MIDTSSTGVTVEHPKSSQMPKATDAQLEIFWQPANDWVRVTPTSVPPGSKSPGGPTGMMWSISGLLPDTQYRIRFIYLCKDGRECPSDETRFTTDEPSSSSSSSGSACPCGGPAPKPEKSGPCELAVPIPTSGMVNVSQDPTLQILWDGNWVTVSKPPSVPSGPQGEVLPGRGGRYWSVSGLQPSTAYFFLFVYSCTDGVSSCKSEIGQGTTTKPCNCGNPTLCGEGCC